jgi:superfamily II DNA or RNA helicase
VPIDWGFEYLPPTVKVVDRTTKGHPITVEARPDPHHDDAPPGQDKFMDEMEAACRENHTVLAEAGTGTGKTVVFLETAARLGRTTIICVHLKRLQKQWVRQIHKLLGVPMDEIGVVVGAKCQYKGKRFVVAMMKTLALRRFEPEFYDYFGIVGYDEVHKCGAFMLSKCLGQFNAGVKVALTATVKRRDKAEGVYLKYFGHAKVVSRQKPMPATIRPVRYKTRVKIWGKTRQQLAKNVSHDKHRNRMLANEIIKLYNDDRQTLVVGDHIDHIESMILLLLERGVPYEHMGQFTDQHRREDGTRGKTNEAYLDWVMEKPPIVFATYGMVTEGIDMPRLDAGIDLTPHSDFKQLLGRIRRTRKGKRPALWVTPLDVSIRQFVGAYHSRLRDVADDKGVTVDG